jgi:hypothetical protein
MSGVLQDLARISILGYHGSVERPAEILLNQLKHFTPEAESSIFLRNIGIRMQGYTTSQHKGPHSELLRVRTFTDSQEPLHGIKHGIMKKEL